MADIITLPAGKIVPDHEYPTYIPFIHLATGISIAGTEMLDRLGAMRGCQWAGKPALATSAFTDLKRAVADAARAVALYEAALASGREKFTDEEYKALMPVEKGSANA